MMLLGRMLELIRNSILCLNHFLPKFEYDDFSGFTCSFFNLCLRTIARKLSFEYKTHPNKIICLGAIGAGTQIC